MNLKILELKFGCCYCCLYKSKHYFNMLVTVIANHISAWLKSVIQLASHAFKFLCALIVQLTAFTLQITSADKTDTLEFTIHNTYWASIIFIRWGKERRKEERKQKERQNIHWLVWKQSIYYLWKSL